jgi:hypothetical protein
MNPKYSLVLAVLAALATIAAIVGQSEDVVAQNQTVAPPLFAGQVTNVTGPVTNFTKLIEDAYTFEFEPGVIGPVLDLLHESPVTLVLRDESVEVLGEVIDIAKRSGYQIDDVTVFTEIRGEPTPTPIYTVFMSKG